MNRKKSEPMLIVILMFSVICLVFMVVYAVKDNKPAVMTGAYAEEASGSEIQSGEQVVLTTTTSAATTTTTTATETGMSTQYGNLPDKIAYLTFDDGPSENTEKILDILDGYGVKATFFVISKKNQDKGYKMIVDRGHTIALHSYTHTYSKIYKSEEAYFDDLAKISDKVYNLTGVRSTIIRFPGGSSNTVHRKYCKGLMKKLKTAVTEKGYVYHDWNVDSGDATGSNVAVETLVNNVKKGAKGRDVIDILMHDTGKSKQTTVEALPEIIEYLLSEGYTILPITADTQPIQHK